MIKTNNRRRLLILLFTVLLALLILPGTVFASGPNELPEDDIINTETNNTVTKKENTITIDPASRVYKRSKLKKKKSFTLTVSNAGGQVIYNLSKKAKKAKIKVKQISYSTAGSGSDTTVTAKYRITVPKKCKKGTYKITVKAAGNDSYMAGEKTLKIRVR